MKNCVKKVKSNKHPFISDTKAAVEFILFITAIILMSIVAGLIIKGVTIFCVNYIWS